MRRLPDANIRRARAALNAHVPGKAVLEGAGFRLARVNGVAAFVEPLYSPPNSRDRLVRDLAGQEHWITEEIQGGAEYPLDDFVTPALPVAPDRVERAAWDACPTLLHAARGGGLPPGMISATWTSMTHGGTDDPQGLRIDR